MKIKRSHFSQIIVYTFLIIVLIIQLFPLYWTFSFSLKDNQEIFGGNTVGLPKKWIFNNYVEVFKDGRMGTYLLNSTIVTSLTIIITLLLSSMASFAIVRMRWKLSKFVYFLFLVGMMLSVQAVLLPLYVNLNPVLDTYWALILPNVAFGIPTAILLEVGALESMPLEIEEAAIIDGATVYRLFFQIILPMLKPIMSTIAILLFLNTWNELMLAITFISSEKYKTITVGVNEMVGKYATKWGPVGAGLNIATIPTLLIFLFFSKNIQKSLVAGAVKG